MKLNLRNSLFILFLMSSTVSFAQRTPGGIKMNFAGNDHDWFQAKLYMVDKTQKEGLIQLDRTSLQNCNFIGEDDTSTLHADDIEFIVLSNRQVIGSFYLHYVTFPGGKFTDPDHKSFIIMKGHQKNLGLFALDNTQQNINSQGVSAYQFYLAFDGSPDAYLVDIHPFKVEKKRRTYSKLAMKTIEKMFAEACPTFLDFIRNVNTIEPFSPSDRILQDYAMHCGVRQFEP